MNDEIEGAEAQETTEKETPQEEVVQSMDDILAEAWDDASTEEDSPEDKPSEEEQPGTDAESDNVAAAADDEDDQTGAEPLSAPEHWSAEDKVAFEAQSDEGKQFLVDRDKTLATEYTKKTQELADQRKGDEPLYSLAEQTAQHFAAQGVTSAQGMAQLVQAQQALMTGTPEQRQTALLQIAQSYGISLTSGAQDSIVDEYQDPELGSLKQDVANLTGYISQMQQQNTTQQQQSSVQLVQSFADEKTDAGELKHPHFELVRGAMAGLMASEGSIEAAYNKAVEPITTLLADAAGKAAETQEKDRVDRVNTAKKAAASNTQGKSNASKPAKVLETVKDAAEDAWDELATA